MLPRSLQVHLTQFGVAEVPNFRLHNQISRLLHAEETNYYEFNVCKHLRQLKDTFILSTSLQRLFQSGFIKTSPLLLS